MLTKQLRGVGFISVLWAPLFILRETNADFSISTNQQHVPSAAEMYSAFASCTNDAQCLNGGTCTPTSSFNTSTTEYARACTCPRGYGGSHCQDHCPLQCQNGGYCQLLDGRDPARYGGSRGSSGSSSTNLESLYDTSYTGSSSSTSSNSYQCKCRGLYAGKLCSIPYQNCPGGHKCYNGGSCVSSASSTSQAASNNNNKYCDCPEGFGGLSCEQRSDGLGAGQGASLPDQQQQQEKAGRPAGIAVSVLLAVGVLAIGFTVLRRRRRRGHQQRRTPHQFAMAMGSTAGSTNLRPHSEDYWEPERMPHSAGMSGLSRAVNREKDPLRSVEDSRRSGIIARSESNDDDDDGEDTMGMVDDNAETKHRWRNIV
jgi:hypothetical protein